MGLRGNCKRRSVLNSPLGRHDSSTLERHMRFSAKGSDGLWNIGLDLKCLSRRMKDVGADRECEQLVYRSSH